MKTLKKVKKTLFDITRTTGKAATLVHDIDILTSGDPKKIMKRIKSKTVYKLTNKIARELTK